MVTEKQVISLVAVVGAGVTFGLAVFNAYLVWKNGVVETVKK